MIKLDTEVWRDVCEKIRNPTILAASIEALKTPDPTKNQREPVEIRKQKVVDEIESLVDLSRTAKSDTARSKISGFLAQAEKELEILEQEEKILSGQFDVWKEAQGEIDKFYSWCRQWQEKLEEASYKDKRVCLEYLGVQVKVFRYGSRPRLQITYNPPDIVDKVKVVLQQF